MPIAGPLLLIGAGLLLFTKPKKRISTKRQFEVIESGEVTRLPKVNEPPFPYQLSMNQAIEILAVDTPVIIWQAISDSPAIEIEVSRRMQDPVTEVVIFALKGMAQGIATIIFNRIKIDTNEIVEQRHIQITVI